MSGGDRCHLPPAALQTRCPNPVARRTSARFCDAGGEPRRWGCWMGMGWSRGRCGVWGGEEVLWACSSRGVIVAGVRG